MINFVIFPQISVALIIFLLDVGRNSLEIRISITVWGNFSLHTCQLTFHSSGFFCVFGFFSED